MNADNGSQGNDLVTAALEQTLWIKRVPKLEILLLEKETTSQGPKYRESPQTFALAGKVLISWIRKVSGFTITTSGTPVVC